MSELGERAIDKLNEQTEKLVNGLSRELMRECIKQYMKMRCAEDEGLCEDILQQHKTVEKCYSYISDKVLDKIQKKDRHGMVSVCMKNETVYELMEDYFRMDDKALEEKKAKEAEERKKQQEEMAKKAKGKREQIKSNKKIETRKCVDKAVEKPATKKKPKEIDGQMDLFSMMGL